MPPQMKMICTFLVIACTACGSRSQQAATVPGPSSPAGSAPADAAQAGGQLYRAGVLVKGGGDRNACRAPADAVAACSCMLYSPPMYWEGPPHCSGVPTPPEDPNIEKRRLASLAVPACMCSCDDAYKTAAAAYKQRLEDCASVP